jgi:hypothetical protein
MTRRCLVRMIRLGVASTGRITLWCALGISILAIVVGRFHPERESGRKRNAASVSIIEVSPKEITANRVPTILDADKWRTVRAPSWLAETLTSPILSTWRDDLERRHVVGFSWNGIVKGERRNQRRFGVLLARYPDGEALSFAPLDLSASAGGRLCWLPGTLARVLFPGADGSLYRIDFERSGVDNTIVRIAQPTVFKIAWQVAQPMSRVVHCNDPVWSSDDRWGGRLIVALRFTEPNRPELSPWRLWWLRLNSSNTAIVDAGPVYPKSQADSQSSTVRERFPSVAVGPDRTLRIAYLAHESDEADFTLHVARFRVDRQGDWRIVSRGRRALLGGCGEIAPVFSSDGRWVFVTERSGSAIRQVDLGNSSCGDEITDPLGIVRGDRLGSDAD